VKALSAGGNKLAKMKKETVAKKWQSVSI